MSKINYNLQSGPLEPLREMPVAGALNIPVKGMILRTARGKMLERGALIAEQPGAVGGDMHAPFAGKVAKVSYAYVTLEPAEGETVAPVDLSAVAEERELLRAMRGLGLDISVLKQAELLVINGLNPEPGVTSAEAILANHNDVLLEGLALARRIVQPARCILVTSGEARVRSLGGCEEQTVRPVYPASIDALVVKAVTGKELPDNVAVLDIYTLWSFGRVALTGLPLTEVVVESGGTDWIVPVGTPLSHVLNTAGVAVAEGDVVRLGGPMRGEAAYSVEQGVNKACRAVAVVRAGSVPPVENVPCINCGECVMHCPARLMPNMITRYAEYDRFEDARKAGLDVCFGCGMCATVCTARRPLLHLIRFAKEQVRARLDA